MTYDRILIATDGSEPAQRAAVEAIGLAKTCDATLVALSVLEVAEPPPWFENPDATPGVDTKAGQAMEGVVSEAAARNLEIDVVEAIVRGQTAPAILEYALEHDIDLIVLGTHGRTGLDRVAVGSVAEHVVRKAPVLVLTIRAADQQ